MQVRLELLQELTKLLRISSFFYYLFVFFRSGSGKSTLVNETLYPLLSKHCYDSKQSPLEYKSIMGLEQVDKVIEIDQSPIGRTPRSNPATYCGFFTDIRTLFAAIPEAKIRGYTAGRF